MNKGIDYIGVSAGAMIFNDKGDLFLSKRGKNASNERGCWETPGGSVDFGEALEDAVKREIKEEYGVDIVIIEQLPAADHLIPDEKQHWIATTFLAKIKDGQTPKIMEPHKCDGIGWFPLDKLPKPLSIITHHDLKAYKEKMEAEMVDIVGQNDNVLFSTSKQNAHKAGLLHRTIIAELRDTQGKWILVKQASDRQDAGQYVSPVGGHVRAGESEIEALIREASEELRLKDFKYKYVGKAIYNRHVLKRQENHYFILYEIFSDKKPRLNHESVSYKSFTEKELRKCLENTPEKLGASFLFILEKFYPHLKSKRF